MLPAPSVSAENTQHYERERDLGQKERQIATGYLCLPCKALVMIPIDAFTSKSSRW